MNQQVNPATAALQLLVAMCFEYAGTLNPLVKETVIQRVQQAANELSTGLGQGMQAAQQLGEFQQREAQRAIDEQNKKAQSPAAAPLPPAVVEALEDPRN